MSGPIELITCITCGAKERDAEGRTRGEQLLAELEARRAHESPVRLASVRCLWACSTPCTVHLRGAGRVGYVVSRLEPSAEAAEALLAYGAMYAESTDGAVPFRRWPDALRGHFLCRLPKGGEETSGAEE